MRVRDVEIALVLAREMKAAAARDVEASLRLEQLREVFSAETLDRAERARIQTALQMAGLDPQPSLLEADPSQPIRFSLAADETADESAATVAPAEAATPERQEFPTVGEFARSAFRRFRTRRARSVGGDEATIATEAAEPQLEGPPVEQPPPVEEPLVEEPVAEEPVPVEEPVADEPVVEETVVHEVPDETVVYEVSDETAVHETLEEPEADHAATNGHAGTNGHGHLDFDGGGILDDVVLPPHDTATPADFGASAETIDFDDPRVAEAEEQWAHEAEPEPEPQPAMEAEPVAEPQAVAVPHPLVEPFAVSSVEEPEPRAGAPEVVALLLPAVAIPVLIASFAGWSFGLAFVALSLIATGVILGRARARLLPTLRSSAATGTVLAVTALVTVVSLAVAAVLSAAGNGDGDTSGPPAAQKPKPPAANPKPQQPATRAHHKRPQHEQPKPKPKKEAPPPDKDTKGLIRIPPSQAAQEPNGTPTTPATPTTPGAQPPTQQQPPTSQP